MSASSRLTVFATGGVLSLVAYLAFVACRSSSDHPNATTAGICSQCGDQQHCAGGLLCRAGTCVLFCRADEECPGSQPACIADVDGLRYCQCGPAGTLSVCSACTPSVEHAQCSAGLVCGLSPSICTKVCRTSADCPAPSTCDQGICKCADAGAPDAGPDGGITPEYIGDVFIGLGSTIAGATFTHVTASPYTCTTTTLPDPNCTWVHCTGDLGGTPTATVESAGVITITGGTKTVTLMPDTMNAYPQFFDGATAAWSAGAMITISAAGGTVPAFSATLAAPMPVTLTSPTQDAGTFTIDRASPLALAWTGGTAGQVTITIAGPEPMGATSIDNITCGFPAASGAGSVPVEALMKLSAGSTGAALGVAVAEKKIVTAGQYAVTLQTYTRATSTIAGAPLTIK